METPTHKSARFRFGGFELDPVTGELIRDGRKTQLNEQPLQLLLALLERPGELMTREELTRKLWPAGTFVDFEQGLNKAVSKLRDALGDSTANPQFIDTLPRKGYRFIAAVTTDAPKTDAPKNDAPRNDAPKDEKIATAIPSPSQRSWRLAVIAGILLALLGIVLATNLAGSRDAITHLLKPSRLQIESLAVLPLENLSGDPAQTYFADGMTDALITEIARAATLRVVSRTTVLRYKTTRKSTQQIGRELDVDAIVEGTILHSGDRVRITAQLIQASTDNHLWAQSYQGDVKEVLGLQQKVATDIARRIGGLVKPVEPARTVNPTAYGEYLKGRFYFLQYTIEGWQQAIAHFNQSIQADPNFAPAYAGLAESYLVARGWNAFPPDEGFSKGKDAAERALQLDSALASSHMAMGVVYLNEWKLSDAERELTRGLELNPNDPLAWQQHGDLLLSLGRFQEAIGDQERARRLDPFSPIVNASLARAFYYSRQYNNAIAQAQETLKLEPKYPVALRWLERSYRQKGMFEEAAAVQREAAKPEDLPTIEHAYRSSGYQGLLRLQVEAYKRNDALIESARGNAQLGNKDAALASLEECYLRHWPGLERLKVDPDFDPIRSDPRFKELLRRVGFQE